MGVIKIAASKQKGRATLGNDEEEEAAQQRKRCWRVLCRAGRRAEAAEQLDAATFAQSSTGSTFERAARW